MVEAFRSRRDVIVEGLNSIPGITCRMPRGAFYVFPNITGTGMSSPACEELLLQKAGVATLSGTSFGVMARATSACPMPTRWRTSRKADPSASATTLAERLAGLRRYQL